MDTSFIKKGNIIQFKFQILKKSNQNNIIEEKYLRVHQPPSTKLATK